MFVLISNDRWPLVQYLLIIKYQGVWTDWSARIEDNISLWIVDSTYLTITNTTKHIIIVAEKKFENINGVIKSRKSKKNREYNDKKNDKRTNNDLHMTTQKTKALTTLKPGSELRCCGSGKQF